MEYRKREEEGDRWNRLITTRSTCSRGIRWGRTFDASYLEQLKSDVKRKIDCLRSHWRRGLMRGSATARLLGLRVRIPPAAKMSVSSECCVLSRTNVCNGLISHPEESYWMWCVTVCDLETSSMRRPWPASGCCAWEKQPMLLWCVCMRAVRLGARTRAFDSARAVLLIQHATRWNIVIWGLSASTTFFYIISNDTIFGKKGTKHNTCILIFSTTFIWNISYPKNNSARLS
jgi:hypothetical protein